MKKNTMNDLEKITLSDGFQLLFLQCYVDCRKTVLACLGKLFDGGREVERIQSADIYLSPSPETFSKLRRFIYSVCNNYGATVV